MPNLQAQQDEGGEGAGASGSGEARRLEQSPHRVELVGGGWPNAIGRVWSKASFSSRLQGFRGVNFTRIWLDGFVFSHAAAVLQMQGMALQDFFPPDTYFLLDGDTEIPGARGPFVFLKGELSKPWEPPLRIKNVFLAAVHAVPEGMTKEDLLALLLEDTREWEEAR